MGGGGGGGGKDGATTTKKGCGDIGLTEESAEYIIHFVKLKYNQRPIAISLAIIKSLVVQSNMH